MSEVSVIPMPVAAEISGAGSFFGSCQIAAGNFESYLQSASGASFASEVPTAFASEAPYSGEASSAGYGTAAAATIGESDLHIEAAEEGLPLVRMFLEKIFNFEAEEETDEIDDNGPNKKLLAKLQELLGEEAGEEAFNAIMDFLEKYETLTQDGNSDFLKIVSALMKSFDPKYMAETPVETQKAELKNILKEINAIFASVNKQTSQPETEIEIAQPETESKSKTAAKAETAQTQTGTVPKAQTEPEIKTEALQPEEAIPLETETIQLEAKIAQSELEPEISLPKLEILKPEQEIPQPGAEAVQPEAKIAQQELETPQPEQEIPLPMQPKTDLAQPEQEIPQQEIKAAQPEAIIAQAKTEIPQPKPKSEAIQAKIEAKAKTEAKTEAKAEAISPSVRESIVLPLAEKLGIVERKELEKFSDFIIEDLLEQGLISLEDFGEYFGKTGVLASTEGKDEFDYFEETLKNLWEIVKSGDETQKEEWLSMLKKLSAGRELSRQLEESLGAEKNADSEILDKTPDKTFNKALDKVLDRTLDSVSKKEDGFKEDEFNSANLVKSAKPSEAKQEKHPVQPEVRAVWEGSTLKIEIVNPKTGEKLQSVETAMPQKLQERIHEFEVIKQIAAHAKFTTAPTGEQKLTVHLRPEHLGQVDLRIMLNNGEMQIHARVESSTAQNALESHIGLLRESLEKQGINLERLEVSVEQKDRQDAYSLAERQEQHEQRQRNRRHRRGGRETRLAVSVKNDANSDTGRRLGYNTMEYLA